MKNNFYHTKIIVQRSGINTTYMLRRQNRYTTL